MVVTILIVWMSMKKLELKFPPLVVTSAFALIIWMMPNPYRINGISLLIVVSVLLLIVGIAVASLGVLEFRKKLTTVNRMSRQDCNDLVVKGIYKYTRNPMYLGFLLWLLSLGLYLANPISLAPIVIFIIYMNHFQIVPKENILKEKFGKDYLDYIKNVRRWI